MVWPAWLDNTRKASLFPFKLKNPESHRGSVTSKVERTWKIHQLHISGSFHHSRLTEGEGAGLVLPWGERQVLGGAPQGLPLRQQRAVQLQWHAVPQVRHEHVSRPVGGLVALVLHPAQRGGGVRSEPGAVEDGVGGVLRRRPHALRVSVRGVCSRRQSQNWVKSTDTYTSSLSLSRMSRAADRAQKGLNYLDLRIPHSAAGS